MRGSALPLCESYLCPVLTKEQSDTCVFYAIFFFIFTLFSMTINVFTEIKKHKKHITATINVKKTHPVPEGRFSNVGLRISSP